MPIDITFSPAPWSDFADIVLGWMRDHLARKTRPWAEEQTPAKPTLLDLLGDPPEVEVGAPEEEEPDADPAPRPAIPPRQILLALRLAVGIGGEAALARMLAPGACTVLGDLAPGEAAAVRELFDAGFLPAGHGATEMDDYTVPAGDGLLIVQPQETDGAVSASAIDRFHRRIGRALEVRAPVLILQPATARLPAAFQQVPRLRLAPAGREIFARLLGEHFGAENEGNQDTEAALHAALPADHHLRGLDPEAIVLALREVSALAAAKRLAGFAQSQTSGIALRDLAGYGEAKEAALGIVEDLAAWRRGDLSWDAICRGLLLCGPPGTGKTELARAIARDGGIGFVSASYADWQAKGHLGDFLRAMAESFAAAQRAAPAILFLDEIDAFQSRSGPRTEGNRNSSYDAKAIAGLLQHLDGIAGREGVVVIAACNHPEQLDPAIRRAGRFDRLLRIGPPGEADLARILRQHLGGDLPGADLARLAAHAGGKTGADCAAAVRVARGAARRQRRTMREADLREALIGKPGDLAPEVLWRTALHEAGHAILNIAADVGTPVSLSITATRGLCVSNPRPHEATAESLRRLRMMHLAGRAAELLILGHAAAGAGGPAESDLATATRLALAEEISFGLGALGPLWLGADPDPQLIPSLPPEVQRSLRDKLARDAAAAGEVLAANRELLLEIARELARTRLLAGPELAALLAKVVPMHGMAPASLPAVPHEPQSAKHEGDPAEPALPSG